MSERRRDKILLFNLDGATCTGCKIAIESFANRIDGVSDCYVETSTAQIQIIADTAVAEELKDAIPAMVAKIGYHAEFSAIADA